MVHEVAATPVLILTGPVGVGKTIVAEELSKLLLRSLHIRRQFLMPIFWW
jgi:tRNA uridine 5-carbamoylmethylation protein Kti12